MYHMVVVTNRVVPTKRDIANINPPLSNRKEAVRFSIPTSARVEDHLATIR